MRTLLLSALLALAAPAGAQYEMADLTDAEITRICAERVTEIVAARRILGAIGMEPTGTELSKLDIEQHKRCEADLALERLLQFERRRLNALALEDARLFGLPGPGEGYHIVWFHDGRIVESPRAARYVNGRAVPMPAPTAAAPAPR